LDTLAPGFLVCRLKKKTCTYDAHEYFTEVPELVERPRVKKAWSLLADWLVPRLTHCYTVGQGLADIFEEKYGVPFGVIRNVPFSKPHKALAKPDTPFIVLYQGALNDGRGLEETIQAMAHLQGVELWLAGEGDLSAALRKMTEKLNLARQVKFLGKLTPDELRLVTDKAHIGLNLLKNKGLSYYHSLANKTFDYIQAGVPSLNMDFPEYKKINGQWAVFLLLDNLEPSNIAAEIDGIRHDKEGYHQLVENCRKAAKHFIWEKEEQKLLEIYQNIR
jgi:glycosyltransferase involved in cell wall biosynthesis